jgi:hypothetical protein
MNHTEPNYILESNLISALRYAIDALKQRESRISPTFCSTLRAGLEWNLYQLECGEGIEVRK